MDPYQNPFRFSHEHNDAQSQLGDHELSKSLCKDAIIGALRNGQVELPVWLDFFEEVLVDRILTDCLFQVVDWCVTQKAFNLDSDFPSFTLCRNGCGLSTQIDVQIPAAEREAK